MSKLSTFLHRHSSELHTVADIFGRIFAAIPIAPVDREEIDNAISSLHKAADSIAASVPAVAKATDVKVSKADIKAAVLEAAAPVIESALEGLVASAVAKALGSKGDTSAPDTASPETVTQNTGG